MDNAETAIMWRSYKRHNAAQLQILAELNACTAEEMRDRLMQAGIGACELPRAKRKKEEHDMEKRMEEQNTQAEEAEEQEYRLPPAPRYEEPEQRRPDLTELVNNITLNLVIEETNLYAGGDADPNDSMSTIMSYIHMRDKLLETVSACK